MHDIRFDSGTRKIVKFSCFTWEVVFWFGALLKVRAVNLVSSVPSQCFLEGGRERTGVGSGQDQCCSCLQGPFFSVQQIVWVNTIKLSRKLKGIQRVFFKGPISIRERNEVTSHSTPRRIG